MLKDTKLNPVHCQHRSDLKHSTARALTLGNDITAYGHDLKFVELTARTYSNLPELTRQSAISTADNLLVDLQKRYNSVPRRLTLRERFIDTEDNRRLFWSLYGKLRAMGFTKREIIANVLSAIS
jgi:hypothetical protein